MDEPTWQIQKQTVLCQVSGFTYLFWCFIDCHIWIYSRAEQMLGVCSFPQEFMCQILSLSVFPLSLQVTPDQPLRKR